MSRLKLSSIIRKLFKFKSYKIHELKFEYGNIIFKLKRTRTTSDCPKCKKRSNNFEEEYERQIRDLDISGKTCFIVFVERKIKCSCGYRGVEKLDFVDKYARQTKRFEEYVSRLCQLMSLKDAGILSRIDWKTVKNIDKKYLKQLVIDLKSITPTGIGVDEVSYQKKHKYLTVVRDIDSGKVIWVHEGRRKAILDLFFKELGESKSRSIKTAVLDMWDPYISSIQTNTNADIVFDKFHIAKKVNEALDSVRKSEFANASDEERKSFKKKRFIILYRKERLDEKKKEELNSLMVKNERLYQAYLLKEQILDIFDEQNEENASVRLERWFENVSKAGFKQFDTVVSMFKSYYYGIKNYFKYHLTNAASEGFNNKIGVIKRRAYGFHDLEYLKLKILQSCGWNIPRLPTIEFE